MSDKINIFKCRFVEGGEQLAIITERNINKATGNRLSIREAMKKYGREIIEEAFEYGSAITKGMKFD